MNQQMLHAIALTLIPGLTPSQQLELLRHYGDAEAIVMRPAETLSGISEAHRVPCVKAITAGRSQALMQAQQEMEFCRRHNIQILPITSEAYPHRLHDCPDAPVVLYYRGGVDLNASHIIAIVGTRQITEYGKQVCLRLTERLAALLPDAVVVSGLAYGVDIHAHRGSMDHGLATVGVVAHGLDQIYPATHRNDARRMIELGGGILTEYVRGTRPLQGNFLRRNRIVAGMADAVIIVECAERSGSLSTARLADSYGRHVYAVPGRINDPYSIGCNKLIARKGALPLLAIDDVIRDLGWWNDTVPFRTQPQQLSLFSATASTAPDAQTSAPALSPALQPIAAALTGTDGLSIAAIADKAGLAASDVTAALFEMEMDGIVKVLPGGLYILSR